MIAVIAWYTIQILNIRVFKTEHSNNREQVSFVKNYKCWRQQQPKCLSL